VARWNDPSFVAASVAIHALVDQHRAALSEREIDVMMLRFEPRVGGMTLEEVGNRLQPQSRERARQLEAGAIQKLRRAGAPIDQAIREWMATLQEAKRGDRA
jgi:DNA-directed RNA polymerase sigma subunit (sigma70/sigma32)